MRFLKLRVSALVLICCPLNGQDHSWSGQTPNFWTLEQRDAGFRRMDSVYQTNPVAVGRTVHRFGRARRLIVPGTESFMEAQRASGLVIIHNNRIRLEKYRLGHSSSGRWESFSVAKSITSTLLGAAVHDGLIRDLNDPVASYIPGLKGSAYENVSIRQLLTMTSGVKWNEDYTDPNSDAVRLRLHRPDAGVDATISYMRQLPRELPAGAKWVYKTGETNLVGALVRQVTGKSLSAYLAEKIWIPYGMERAAAWELDTSGAEMGGCCLSASLRDYARFGQFVLDGGRIGGKPILPSNWLSQATSRQVETGSPDRGYGYQWWTNSDGTFQASGIFGQCIFIDPRRHLVIAVNANWPTATNPALARARAAFFRTVQTAVEAEQ